MRRRNGNLIAYTVDGKRQQPGTARKVVGFIGSVQCAECGAIKLDGESSEMNDQQIKNCPHCDGQPIRVGPNVYYKFSIRCISCAAEGGWGKSAEAAARMWNMRTEDKLREAVVFFVNQTHGTKIDERLSEYASFQRLKELIESPGDRRIVKPAPSSTGVEFVGTGEDMRMVFTYPCGCVRSCKASELPRRSFDLTGIDLGMDDDG